MDKKELNIQINCQKGKRIDVTYPINSGMRVYEEEQIRMEVSETISGGCRLGRIRLHIKNEACRENTNLRMEKPIRVYLPAECPEKITAMYLYNEWWTRPAFVETFQNIPDFTQVAFFKYHDRFACFIPMVGRKFKTYMVEGTKTEIGLEMTVYLGGQRELDDILARPVSAVSRNSDDFVPDKENGFAEHLLQNAYNAVYHNELYCCDWDMFWTKHEDCIKYSLLRAISGGPVYFSDKIGDTDPEVLKPLIYQDGRVLRMERSAKPAEDCIFSDPLEEGVLKLHNVAPWGQEGKGGGIAVYNLTRNQQEFMFKPSDIPDLEISNRYWVFDYFHKKAVSLGRDEEYKDTVKISGFAWFIILPRRRTNTCLGLLDKYAGFLAVESICEDQDTTAVILHESGSLGWLSEKEPEKVLVNGKNVTESVEKEGQFYRISLPEEAHKTALLIKW